MHVSGRILHIRYRNDSHYLKAVTEMAKFPMHLLCLFLAVCGAASEWTLFGNKYYKYSASSVNWTAAQAACRNENGNLVEINSADENEFLGGLRVNNISTWIGLNDRDEEYTHVWASSGSSPNYTNWNKGQPNDEKVRRVEDCVEMSWYNAKWNDARCEFSRYYFCERYRTDASLDKEIISPYFLRFG